MDWVSWINEKIGLDAVETAWVKTHPLPYVVIEDNTARRGADRRICITEHMTTLYFCSAMRDQEREAGIEAVLEEQEWEYSKETEYDRNDKLYVTTYYLEFLEKEERNE